MPCSSASCLTGLGCSFWPRPAGRSGWVSTSGTSKPAARIAASAARAKSGVPAKRLSRGDPRLLGELVLDARLLQLRQVLDEDLALQVIHLVLDADRQQILGLDFEGLAVEAQARTATFCERLTVS